MTAMFRMTQKPQDDNAAAPLDRFEARLEALAGTLDRPAVLRRSPFERIVRNQPQLREV